MICCSHIIFLSFLHQVSPPCQQTGVASGLPCIFPFTYKGKEYQCCSTEDEPNDRPWCPLVHAQVYTGSAGTNWDYCRKFIHKFGGCYRDQKTRINNACRDILTENEKKETFAKWMPDYPPFLVGGSFEEKLLKLKIYGDCHAFELTSQGDSAEGKEAHLLLISVGVYWDYCRKFIHKFVKVIGIFHPGYIMLSHKILVFSCHPGKKETVPKLIN